MGGKGEGEGGGGGGGRREEEGGIVRRGRLTFKFWVDGIDYSAGPN